MTRVCFGIGSNLCHPADAVSFVFDWQNSPPPLCVKATNKV